MWGPVRVRRLAGLKTCQRAKTKEPTRSAQFVIYLLYNEVTASNHCFYRCEVSVMWIVPQKTL